MVTCFSPFSVGYLRLVKSCIPLPFHFKPQPNSSEALLDGSFITVELLVVIQIDRVYERFRNGQESGFLQAVEVQ